VTKFVSPATAANRKSSRKLGQITFPFLQWRRRQSAEIGRRGRQVTFVPD